MKKNLLALMLLGAGLGLNAQTPRLALYEEFTGETCPPCAATNPGLNALLSLPTNTVKAVAIKWQVPIPTAPTNTWSLYQTNKTEIDWRYSTYGYGINSAPSGKMDGQNISAFMPGGNPSSTTSNHPASLTSGIIANAQSTVSAFAMTMNRAWDQTYSSVNVTVNIAASMSFTSTGALVFRLVMVEKYIQFPVQSGTNGEKVFEDVVIKSFPNIQTGTAMTGTWTAGQTQTIVLNCPVPSYVRDKGEVAFVGFIQDDGNFKVAQAVRADKDPIPNDAKAVSASIPNYFSCGTSASPEIVVKNNGGTPITSMTITPSINAVAANVTTWNGSLPAGASTTIPLSAITPTTNGGIDCMLNISAVSGTDNNPLNNTAKTSFYLANNFQGTPVVQSFSSAIFPPAKWGVENMDGGSSWSRAASGSGSAKYDFFNNNVIGDADDLYLPPMDLTGAGDPILTFDVAHATYSTSADKLEVLVSEDCGVNWVSLYEKEGADLSTNGGVSVPTAFTPNTSQWRKDTVYLDQFTSLATILVKFRATSAYGNNLYIDNVNMKQNYVGIKKQSNNVKSVSIYPNPSQADANIDIKAAKAGTAKISVVNVLGQVVFTKEAALNAGVNTVPLNVTSFATGVYNVLIDADGATTVKKLSVAH